MQTISTKVQRKKQVVALYGDESKIDLLFDTAGKVADISDQ